MIAARLVPCAARGRARRRRPRCGRATGPPRSRLFVLGDDASAGRSTTRLRTSPRSRSAPGYRLGAARLGALRAAAGRLPHEPLRGARPALDGLDAPARALVLPRPAGNAGLPRVRPGVRGAAARPGPLRARPGHPPRDGGARRSPPVSTPTRVHRIPIGIELDAFPLADAGAARRRAGELGLPATRSSSARSRRTASGSATGSSRSRSRAPTCSSTRSRARRDATLDELVVLLTGPARGYVRAELDRPRDPVVHRLLPGPRRARDGVPRARRLPRRVAPGRRPEEHPRVDGHRRAARHDAGRPGARPRRRRRERAAGRRRGRRRARRRARAVCTTTRRSSSGCARRGAARPRRTRTRAWRRAGRRSSRASPSAMDSGRVGRYGRAAARWARLLAGGRARARPPRLLRLGRDPGPGRAGRGRAPRSSRSSRSAGRIDPTDFSLLYLGTTYLPRDLRPLLWLAGAGGRADRRQPGRRRVPGLGGRADGRAQRAAPPRRARRPTTSSTRARSASARRTSSSASRAGRGRSFRTRSTSSGSRPGPLPPDGPVVLLGGDQTQAYRLELALETFRLVLDAHPDARLLVSGRLVSDPAPTDRAARARRRRSSSSAATRRRRRPTCSAARTCSSTRRSTTPARRRSSRRSRAASPSRTPRAAARSSSSATRRASASRIPTASSATSRPRRRRSPRPSAPSSTTASATRSGARRRAVERFALADWLDRHAAIFAELDARVERRAPPVAQAADAPASVAAWKRARVAVEQRRARPSAPSAGRTSIRATARAG